MRTAEAARGALAIIAGLSGATAICLVLIWLVTAVAIRRGPKRLSLVLVVFLIFVSRFTLGLASGLSADGLLRRVWTPPSDMAAFAFVLPVFFGGQWVAWLTAQRIIRAVQVRSGQEPTPMNWSFFL
jgi:hypothetical protein